MKSCGRRDSNSHGSDPTRPSTWRVCHFATTAISAEPGNRTLLHLFVGQWVSPETELGVVAADGFEPSRPSLWGSSAPSARSVGALGENRTRDSSFGRSNDFRFTTRARGVPGRIRTSDARFVATHDVHFTPGTMVALAGFEPARTHAKRPIGKRASHAQPPGHATVHPQPWSQPTSSKRGSRSWVPLSRFRFHVFPVSCLLLYRAVEVAGVEPAYLCLQGSEPSRRRPRCCCSAPLRNRTGSFRASTGRADHLRKTGGALAVGIEPTWFRWTDGSPHQRRRRAMVGVKDGNRTRISRSTAARSCR